MKIGVVGTGYVGLVSGACLSDFGHSVICFDKDKDKIKDLENGKIPIYEPGLEALVKKNVEANRLIFSTDLNSYIDELSVLFVAVDTPAVKLSGKANLDSFYAVIQEILKLSSNNMVIVIKSTVPVGTNKEILSKLLKNDKDLTFELVSNPEFLREGSAIDDFMRPDRVIVGTNSVYAKEVMEEIYKPLYLRDFPIVYTDPESAEMIKYASNAFLATKISFINEVASLCEKTGANVKEVAKGMGLDNRIGSKFLHAGPGYGGSCFPKDTLAFIKTGQMYGARQRIVETVISVNSEVKNRMVEKIDNIFNGHLDNKIICFFGITFKPNTDDIREAPSLTIIPEIQLKNAKIRIVDRKGEGQGKMIFKGSEWYSSPYEAASGADLVVILTEWNEFRALDLNRISSVMRTPIMADLRNVYSKSEVISNGFKDYISVGRIN